MKTNTESYRYLVKVEPLMGVKNRAEFYQRLQWLSEGMLSNHINPVSGYYTINEFEKFHYNEYKRIQKLERRGV